LKILYHHRTQGRGAEGVHIMSIVHALEEQGHEVDVATVPGVSFNKNIISAPLDKSKQKLSGVESILGTISRRLPGVFFEIIEIAYNLVAYKHLNVLLKKGNYDLVYERYAFFLLAGALTARNNRVPFVLEVNEVNGIENRARKQYLKSICGIIEKKVMTSAQRVITVSSYLQKRILDQYGNEITGDVIIAPNAIDLSKIPKKYKLPRLEEKYKLKSFDIVLGFAGWFDNWDRLDLLVELCVRLNKKGHSVAILLIGDGVGVAAAKELAESNGVGDKIIFTGAVARNEIYVYLSLIDVAVFAHSNDFGSPVVMFEFMGLKIPIVAPRLDPIEDVLVNEETALLFDRLDIEQLVQCAERCVVDTKLARKIAENAYELVKTRHTWAQNASLITAAL